VENVISKSVSMKIFSKYALDPSLSDSFYTQMNMILALMRTNPLVTIMHEIGHAIALKAFNFSDPVQIHLWADKKKRDQIVSSLSSLPQIKDGIYIHGFAEKDHNYSFYLSRRTRKLTQKENIIVALAGPVMGILTGLAGIVPFMRNPTFLSLGLAYISWYNVFDQTILNYNPNGDNDGEQAWNSWKL
jgi:hypothetical protein